VSDAALPVSVVIPAYNEAERIAATARAARALTGVGEVIVVDDGSADDTGKAAAMAGATVVHQVHNRGKAAAMEAGADAATGALLLFLDADLGATACEAQVLIAPVLSGETDVTIATFPVIPGRGGGMGLVVRLSRAGIRWAAGRTLVTPLSGQRCLTRTAFAAARPLARGFGVETAMTIDLLRAGFRILEIPTKMDHRVTQNDLRARLHRLRQLRDVGLALAPRLLPKQRS
jgi:glycosyltransferase involved in cell wall biosynthesis